MKKVLILSGSPRKGGNSNILCDQFAKGAREAGSVVEKIRVADKKIAPCRACYYCRDHGGIANWRTMQRRIEALSSMGCPRNFMCIAASATASAWARAPSPRGGLTSPSTFGKETDNNFARGAQSLRAFMLCGCERTLNVKNSYADSGPGAPDVRVPHVVFYCMLAAVCAHHVRIWPLYAAHIVPYIWRAARIKRYV